jgi:putative CocE/NonD family hydrolase
MHRMAELDVPALHITGWYDDDGPSTYNNYPNARKLAKSKDEQYVLIGPWPHATNTKTVVQGVDFGPEETIDINGFILDWLDKQIGGRPESWGDRQRARIFLIGENQWHDMKDWPPPGTKEQAWHLASDGNANSLFGDGQLLWHRFPTGESGGMPGQGVATGGDDVAFDEYAYDPDHPTPYLYDAGTLQVGGPFDARPVQRRDDVLCYTSEPLAEDLVICGRMFAELYVSSSAEDTEFCAMLCDVHPNGHARQLCDGNLRLCLRNSLEKRDPVPPAETAKVRIDMWATGVRVFEGHRLRLQVASTKVVVAQNRVHHDKDHQSRLLLPVVS